MSTNSSGLLQDILSDSIANVVANAKKDAIIYNQIEVLKAARAAFEGLVEYKIIDSGDYETLLSDLDRAIKMAPSTGGAE